MNCGLIQQLQKYMDENNHLGQQKISLEEDNSIFVTEVRDIYSHVINIDTNIFLISHLYARDKSYSIRVNFFCVDTIYPICDNLTLICYIY